MKRRRPVIVLCVNERTCLQQQVSSAGLSSVCSKVQRCGTLRIAAVYVAACMRKSPAAHTCMLNHNALVLLFA